jgi:hypothetical protein
LGSYIPRQHQATCNHRLLFVWYLALCLHKGQYTNKRKRANGAQVAKRLARKPSGERRDSLRRSSTAHPNPSAIPNPIRTRTRVRIFYRRLRYNGHLQNTVVIWHRVCFAAHIIINIRRLSEVHPKSWTEMKKLLEVHFLWQERNILTQGTRLSSKYLLYWICENTDYNNKRISLKLKGMSPVQYRTHSRLTI